MMTPTDTRRKSTRRPVTLEAMPPSDSEHDLARAALATVLLDPNFAWPFVSAISLEKFPAGLERNVAEAMHTLAADGKPIDMVLVISELQRAGRLDECGGAATVVELTNNTPTSANAEYYAQQLSQLAGARILGELLNYTRVKLAEPGADPPSIITALTDTLSEELGAAGTCTTTDLSLVATANWLEEADKPREDLFINMIPRGAPCGVSADGGTGKTMMAIQMAVAHSTGRPMAPFVPADGPGVVLGLFGEDNWNIVARRIKTYAEEYRIPVDEIDAAFRERLYIVEAPATPLTGKDRNGNLTTTDAYLWVGRQVERIKPSLILLDSQAQWYGGNENDAIESTYFVNRLKALAKPSNATVVVLHHLNKLGATRGSTAFRNAFRWHAELLGMTADEANDFGVSADDRLKYVRLHVEKINDGELPADVWLRKHQGGVLRATTLTNDRYRNLATALAQFLTGLDAMTENEITREPAGREVRECMTTLSGGRCTAKDLKATISHGLKAGILTARTTKSGKTVRYEIIPSCQD